jgi:hypothetical protein
MKQNFWIIKKWKLDYQLWKKIHVITNLSAVETALKYKPQ